MLPVLQIGPVSLATPGLALIAGLWLGLEAASRLAQRRSLDGEALYSAWFNALIAGMLGARLGFVLLNLPLYAAISPAGRLLRAIAALSPGTENLWFGLAVGIAALIYSARRKGLPLLPMLDVSAPGLLIFAAGAALANFLSGAAYGLPTRLPWAINLWGAMRHPTQLYLMVAALSITAFLWRMERLSENHTTGLAAQLGLLLYGLSLLLIEPLRADSPLIGAGLRVWQFVGLAAMLIALGGFALRAGSLSGPGDQGPGDQSLVS